MTWKNLAAEVADEFEGLETLGAEDRRSMSSPLKAFETFFASRYRTKPYDSSARRIQYLLHKAARLEYQREYDRRNAAARIARNKARYWAKKAGAKK